VLKNSRYCSVHTKQTSTVNEFFWNMMTRNLPQIIVQKATVSWWKSESMPNTGRKAAADIHRPSDCKPPAPDVQKTETNPQHASEPASTNFQRKTAGMANNRNRIRTL